MTTPLTPRTANNAANKLPPPPTSPNSRLPQKTPVQSPSKFKNALSSPFMSLSPIVTSSTRGSLAKVICFDDDFDPFGDMDDSVCSNFSDVTSGAYNNLAVASAKKMKSPTKQQQQQTPGSRSPTKIDTTTTPHTIRTSPVDSDLLSEPRTPTGPNNQPTQNLLDFTQQFDATATSRPENNNGFSNKNIVRNTSSHRRTQSSVSPRRTQSSASPRKGTPAKTALPPATPTESRFFNLLDFSPAPLATPRSIPSITPREVEELKAGFNSQVSMLTAQLSGREVEVTGLRTAVQETEARCAELTNNIEEVSTRLEDERGEWQRVKVELGELFEAERAEKESISTILAEKEQVVEHLHSELEGKTVEVKNLKKRLRDTEDELERTREEVLRVRREAPPPPPPPAAPVIDEEAANKKTQEEVERVARELHTLYKAKHETKVAALKKSYESRWEKKVLVLQQQIAELTQQNGELAKELEEKHAAAELNADMSFSAPEPPAREDEELRRKIAELEIEIRNERQEKEGIVALVEELLTIQAEAKPPPPPVEEKEEEERRRGSGGLRSGIEKMGMGGKRAEAKQKEKEKEEKEKEMEKEKEKEKEKEEKEEKEERAE